VQPDINGMLDVARKTFLQSVEDIYELADSYTQEFPEAPATVKATTSRGYHLQVSVHSEPSYSVYMHICAYYSV
jgi:hypothetical protein